MHRIYTYLPQAQCHPRAVFGIDDGDVACLRDLVSGLARGFNRETLDTLSNRAALNEAAAQCHDFQVGGVLDDFFLNGLAHDGRVEAVVVEFTEKRVDPDAAGEGAGIWAALQEGTDTPEPVLGGDRPSVS